MKVFRFVSPYIGKNKINLITRFPDRQKSGVYLIKENGKIVYVGYSGTDLYKTMYRHFQGWNHVKQEVVTYAGRKQTRYKDLSKITVRVVYCTPKQAEALEMWLVKKLKPRDNENLYESREIGQYPERVFKTYQETVVDSVPF